MNRQVKSEVSGERVREKESSIISTLYNSTYYQRLWTLLSKFFRSFPEEKLKELLQKKLTDREYVAEFKQISRPVYGSNNRENRAKMRLAEVKKVLGRRVRLDHSAKFLDIGASDCSITAVIGKGLGYGDDKVYAADIVEQKNGAIDGVKFELIDGKTLPFEDNSFSFITAFQVLHHMRELLKMLAELKRCSKDGAFLLIREQDCRSNMDNQLFDLEHMLYDVVIDGMDYDKFWEEYYADFYDRHAWSDILDTFGYSFMRVGNIRDDRKPNPTNYYYALYRLKK